MSGERNKISVAVALLLSLGILSCGGSSNKDGKTTTLPGFNNVTDFNSDIEEDPNFDPAVSDNFILTGSTGTKPSFTFPANGINTDTIAQVMIKSGPASYLTVPGSSGTMQYGCVRYDVQMRTKINGTWTDNGGARTTPILKVEGTDNSLCPNAKTYVIMDFSSRTGGDGPIQFRVDNARYSFYCQLWHEIARYYGEAAAYAYMGTKNQYCTDRAVYRTHTVKGHIGIKVNGTNISD